MSNRRQFIKLAGAGAAASLISTVGAAAAPQENAAPAAVPPRRLFLGLASYSTRKHSLDETLKIAERLELRHLCLKDFHLPLDSSPEKLAQAAEKARAAGIDLYGCGVVKMSNPAEVNRAFEYAKGAGMRVIVAVPAFDVLPLVNDKIKQYDISVAIHNHGPEDKLYPRPEATYKKIKKFDPRLGLCLDIGHTMRSGIDPARAAERCADRLLDVHIKDVSIAAAEGRTIEAGRGVIDLPGFLRVMKKIHYPGVLSFEYEKDPGDILPGLAESVGYVRGVLAAID
ncbi:MAG: sugar phosphate isomerase/epimerase [Pirellulaceae bacterium]|nr:sugar phosphate isomerase/epimerase [Pirellulaceae bacterium]